MANYAKRETVKLELKPLNGRYVDLPKRQIPEHIAKKWKLLYVPDYLGQPCLAATYTKNGELAGYNIKPKDYPTSRKCYIMGNIKEADMYGADTHADPEGRTLVITTGHEDCAIANMVVGDAGYNFTSLKHGDNSVDDFVKVHYDKLSRYKSIILCFDMDASGQAAVAKFLSLYNQIGKVKIAKLPYKDANEMYIAGKANDLKWAIVKAETYIPPTSVEIEDVIEEALQENVTEWHWPWKGLDTITHGGRRGEMYLWAAPSGIGKTEVLAKLKKHLMNNDIMVGSINLEQKPCKELQRIAAGELNKRIYLPGVDWGDKQVVKAAMEKYKGKIIMYDKKHGAAIDNIIQTIFYWVNARGVKVIFIDNIKAMCTKRVISGKQVGEIEYISYIGERLYSLLMELDVQIHIVSHMKKSDIKKQTYTSLSPKRNEEYEAMTAQDVDKLINKHGLTWGTGRVGTVEDIYGANTIEAFSDFIFVLSRNKESNDDFEHRTLYMKCVKNRLDSKFEGDQVRLVYGWDDGDYHEVV